MCPHSHSYAIASVLVHTGKQVYRGAVECLILKRERSVRYSGAGP